VSDPLRILLADDHPMFREGVRFTLDREADLVVVGEAATGSDALRLTAELDPDVVVMDLAMPDLGGLAATRRLTESGARARVLVLTMSEDDESVFAALRAGAGGYLVKGADPDQVISAVRAVGRGHAVFGPHLAARMLTFFGEPPAPEPEPVAGLSAREREVLTLLAEGLSNAEIGRALFISPITVRNHVSSIFAKLQVSNRRQAMLRVARPAPGELRPPLDGALQPWLHRTRGRRRVGDAQLPPAA
jgi:DNA-binding NarL/FixJ family response regulator